MRKFTTFLILIILIAAFGFYYYTVLMPKKLSDAIVEEQKEIPKFIPKKYKKHVLSLKKEVNNNSEQMIDYINNKDVTFEDLLYFIDEVQLEEIEEIMNNADSTDFSSSANLFDYLTSNYDFGNIPMQNFKTDFIQKIDSAKISKALQYYSNNKEQLPLIFPLAKQTIKKVIIRKRSEIEAKLNDSDTTAVESAIQ